MFSDITKKIDRLTEAIAAGEIQPCTIALDGATIQIERGRVTITRNGQQETLVNPYSENQAG